MRRRIVCLVLLMVTSVVPMAVAANSDRVHTRLSGFNEVHFSAGPPATLRGAISTGASGQFAAEIDQQADLIHYKLSYQDLEGTVTQAHIHFGQQHTVGGIVVWLCQTEGTPAPPEVADLTPFCPEEGPVMGTITPAQVLTATNQGLEAGEFDELVQAIRTGTTYANVYSSLFPPGEIRGQLKGGREE